jgi:ribonucleotide monophosphatase NagD (HAD superfamily)
VYGAHRTTLGKQLVFVTNNSTKSRADYKKKFDSMGISASEVNIPDYAFYYFDGRS